MKIKKVSGHGSTCRHRNVELDNGRVIIYHDDFLFTLLEEQGTLDERLLLLWLHKKLEEGIEELAQLDGLAVGKAVRRAPGGTTLAIGAGAGV